MSDRLIPILERTRQHVAARKALLPLEAVHERLGDASPPRGFLAALRRRRAQGTYGLIAEMKRASPSRGRIVEDFDAARFARDYQAGGAACLSVLTDEPYFQGLDEDLAMARNAVALPVLRKDFMVDPYQIAESRLLGADCILLIAAALDDAQLADFAAMARDLGMDALVEVHDRTELDRALKTGAPLVGINNRNLKSLQIDLSTSRSLAEHIPPDVLAVSESGLSTPADLREMADAGISTFLIGESLLRRNDLQAAVRTLLIDGDKELK
jgi:indole-3-glycerol phosphate synthase